MGLLTGTFTKERAAGLPDNDVRARNAFFTEPALSRNLAFVDKLRPIAARNKRTVSELAIAWVLRRPEVTAAIVGGRRPQQVDDVVAAADWDLSPRDAEEIDALLVARAAL